MTLARSTSRSPANQHHIRKSTSMNQHEPTKLTTVVSEYIDGTGTPTCFSFHGGPYKPPTLKPLLLQTEKDTCTILHP